LWTRRAQPARKEHSNQSITCYLNFFSTTAYIQ
jgi:hypothetical protein